MGRFTCRDKENIQAARLAVIEAAKAGAGEMVRLVGTGGEQVITDAHGRPRLWSSPEAARRALRRQNPSLPVHISATLK
jgi:hypothetical protein